MTHTPNTYETSVLRLLQGTTKGTPMTLKHIARRVGGLCTAKAAINELRGHGYPIQPSAVRGAYWWDGRGVGR